jgi:DNA-binding CsgD family transcriptional regulator
MTRSHLTEFSQLLLVLYRNAQELPVSQFQDAALQAVKPLLHFDGCTWGTGTMTAQGVDVHSMHRYRFSDAMFAAFGRVAHQDSAAVRVTSQPRMTIGFSAEEEFHRPEQAGIREFASEYGQHHCFITCDINPLTRFAHWVSLFRSDPARRCRQEEIEFLEALAPHLMQSVTINRLVHLDRLVGDAARESWAVAIADARGVVYHAEQRFRELLKQDFPLDGDRLPGALLGRIEAGEPRIQGERVVLQHSLEQGLFFLKARARHPVDTLSPREFAVAEMVASGLTQKQVAARVGRSPETIRSQVKAIFAKLDINTATLLPPLLVLRQ